MTDCYLQLRKIHFKGPSAVAGLDFKSGINVICGSSDTGKSFLVDSIDFMLGRSQLKDIPQRDKYDQIDLTLATSINNGYKFSRSMSGGDFQMVDLTKGDKSEQVVLKQRHADKKTDNLSGFLLDTIGLLGKRILKNNLGTTQSLSFRNLARLVIVPEQEIQQVRSPFLSGQHVTKTSEIATIKLLLSGIDDSAVVKADDQTRDNTREIALIDEILGDLQTEIEDIGEDREELQAQLARLEVTIEKHHEVLSVSEKALDELLAKRRELFKEKQKRSERIEKIGGLLSRFTLLANHYDIDLKRLTAIQESGKIFAHIEQVICPVCGAAPDAQHLDKTCGGDIEAIIISAAAEIQKIQQLQAELTSTVTDLKTESNELTEFLETTTLSYEALNKNIEKFVDLEVTKDRSSFSDLVEKRARVQTTVELFDKYNKYEKRKTDIRQEKEAEDVKAELTTGISNSTAHAFSIKVSEILRQWHFPGKCEVSYDKNSSDFQIDGKLRSSHGKGLRAITHAAVKIALLEFCQAKGLPHPGFVVLDSPLLAYFKPEGDEDQALQETDLKERFYDYLIEHHGQGSQVIIIENQHPPERIEEKIALTIFTANPTEGRYGLL